MKLKPVFQSSLFRLVLGTLGVVGLGITLLARGPNFELRFDRKVAANESVTASDVDRVFRDLRQWPRWFHTLASAETVGEKTPWLKTGQVLELKMDPSKGARRKFTLRAQVIEYTPARRIVLRVTQDSKERLTNIFDRLEWVINVEPGAAEGGKTLLRAEAVAQTNNWRGRLFGRLSDRILMNQVYYPNLFKLAKINDPVTNAGPELH